MNRLKIIAPLCLLILFSMCKKENELLAPTACGAELLLWKSKLEYGAATLDVEVNKIPQPFTNPLPMTSQGSVLGLPQERVIFSSNGSVYDANKELFSILIPREQKMIQYDLANGQGSILSLDSLSAAPVLAQGKYWAIRVLPKGYNRAPLGEFEIAEIDSNTGKIIGNPLVSSQFNLHSFFSYESMSSATDGANQLYFLSVTNLIVINLTNRSFKALDLYPNFDANADYTSFFGLEYYSADRLIAIRKTSASQHDLVEIDISGNTPKITTLLDITSKLPATGDWVINSEFYSSALDNCDNKYYLTTLEKNDPVPSTKLVEIDWKNGATNLQSVPDYMFGIELIP